VTFVRTALGPNARGGLELVQIAEIGGEGGPVLVRRRAPFVPTIQGVNDRDPPSFADPVVLVRPPFRVSFSYAGTDRVWNSTWRALKVLPRAVRVAVRDATSGRTVAVSTATLVHTEIPITCVTAQSLAECLNQPPPGTPPAGQPREL
jgi:general secretion pathway protein J